MIEREWYVQCSSSENWNPYLQLILGPNLTKKNCAWISQFAAGVYWSCAAWMTLEGFHILTVNNYQLSKIKTETPINKCRLPKQANHMQLYLFSYYGTTLPDYNILCSIENFRQLSESIDWFCPNVWSFCVGVTVLLYCIWTCRGTINESAY